MTNVDLDRADYSYAAYLQAKTDEAVRVAAWFRRCAMVFIFIAVTQAFTILALLYFVIFGGDNGH